MKWDVIIMHRIIKESTSLHTRRTYARAYIYMTIIILQLYLVYIFI